MSCKSHSTWPEFYSREIAPSWLREQYLEKFFEYQNFTESDEQTYNVFHRPKVRIEIKLALLKQSFKDHDKTFSSRPTGKGQHRRHPTLHLEDRRYELQREDIRGVESQGRQHRVTTFVYRIHNQSDQFLYKFCWILLLVELEQKLAILLMTVSLKGDISWGAEEQFKNEALMAVRTANFISAFLQGLNKCCHMS